MPRLVSLLSLATAARAGAWDASEWLRGEDARDAGAYNPAKSWCDDMSDFMAARISKAADDMQSLSSTVEERQAQNDQWRSQVKEHKREAGSHADTMGTASAISERDGAASQQEVADLKARIDSLTRALDTVKEGSQIHDTLKGLRDSLSEKLARAEQSQTSRQSEYDDLRESKLRMGRLARQAAATKEARLAGGLAEVASARAQMDKLSAQREKDAALGSAARDLCGMLGDQAAKRRQLRHAAGLAVSQAKADAAQASSYEAATRSFNLLSRGSSARSVAAARHGAENVDCAMQLEHAQERKRRASESLEDAKRSASAMIAHLDRSSGLQSALERMLHGAMTGAHLATGRSSGDAKAAFEAMFDAAQAQLASLAAPFDAVRARGRTSVLAASQVVTVLMGAEADASQAVLDAKRCRE